MATLTQTGQTLSGVTVTCSGLDPSHARTRYFRWELVSGGTTVDTYDDTLAPYSSSHTGSFTGLNVNETYTVVCSIYDDSGYTDLLAQLSCQASTLATALPYIWDGSAWVPATPYIWDGSAWTPAVVNIYDGGWQP